MLAGGNSNIFLWSSLFGEDSHFDSYVSNGLKPPIRLDCCFKFENEQDELIHGGWYMSTYIHVCLDFSDWLVPHRMHGIGIFALHWQRHFLLSTVC